MFALYKYGAEQHAEKTADVLITAQHSSACPAEHVSVSICLTSAPMGPFRAVC